MLGAAMIAAAGAWERSLADVMAALYLLPVKWLLASAGCATAGLLAWLLLSGIAQIWPALRTRRAVWLAAQCMVAAAALLPFLPHSLHPAPPITLPPLTVAVPIQAATVPAPGDTHAPAAAETVLAIAPAAAMDPATTATATTTPGARASTTPAAIATAWPATTAAQTSPPTLVARVLPWMAAAWLLVYAAGLAQAVRKQLLAKRMWRTLMATAHRLSPAALQVNGAFTTDQRRQIAEGGLTVMRTDAAISPMLIGVLRPTLLLPANLNALSTEQQQMIITHELHHWRVRDPLCLAIAAMLQTVFWFNPALRWMAKQMEWALELQCDQHVLAGRPQHQRKQYAASLLQQWATPMGGAAFNGAAIAARIQQMQKAGLPALSAAAAWTSGAALIAVLAAGAMLQPALAFSEPARSDAAPAAADADAGAVTDAGPIADAGAVAEPAAGAGAVAGAGTTPAAPAEVWRAPLEKVRVTSFFGVQRSVPHTPHKGIDFGAAKGTPVFATAAGTIIAAGPIAENNGKYGTTVIIDHGAQHSLYAHLNSVNVRPGQRVQAGQRIGAVGETGLATGPHLHLEVRQNGNNIDPATMFANLDAHATPRALKVRRQQLTPKG